jgi:hypothetical protein
VSTLATLSVLSEALHRFEPPWIEVGRVYRRICFLRSEGLAVDAQHVEETEFAQATARARESSVSEFEADSILKSLLAEEEERVAEAVAFAEVLVPMLSKRLSGLAPLPPAAPALRRPRVPAHDETRGIADFIDDMLAQERSGPR